jgi:glycine betaine/proline transport system substrate-binding protein
MKLRLLKAVLVMLALSLAVFGCKKQEEGEKAVSAGKKKVELIYVEWSSEVASTNVVKAVLQEKMGYEAEMIPVSGAAMWQGIASRDADAMVAAWLPTTHGHYLEKVKDKVVDLGPNLVGTRIGLVVPQYVTIDSIEELNANADKFNGKIIGIDPGAGLMSKTEKVLEEYNLDKMELIEGSGATMTASLADAVKQGRWVVVTGWTPHWKFAKWDLKYLEDPKGVYGGEEEIHTVVRQGLEEEMPDVYRFLDNFSWSLADMQQVMVWNQEGENTPYENAKRWIEENPEKVAAWLP